MHKLTEKLLTLEKCALKVKLMFESSVYTNRRRALMALMAEKATNGVVIFLGNNEAPMAYRGNDYKFRQDSSFLYFWGIDEPGFAAIIDLDNGTECLYGNDVDIDDIIWMGPQPSVASKGALVGCSQTAPFAAFEDTVKEAVAKGRAVHFLPPTRYCNVLKLNELTGWDPASIRKVAPMAADNGRHASEELVKSVVSLRLIKEQCEIEEIDNAMYTADHPYYVGGIEWTLFPIPLKYIQLNSGAVMAQNPGWE